MHTGWSSFLLCRIFVRETTGKSNSSGYKFSKLRLGFSEGQPHVAISSSQAGVAYYFTGKRNRKDVKTKQKDNQQL